MNRLSNVPKQGEEADFDMSDASDGEAGEARRPFSRKSSKVSCSPLLSPSHPPFSRKSSKV